MQDENDLPVARVFNANNSSTFLYPGLSRQEGFLQQFQLQGVRDTGRTIGDGSYATVVELDFRGLKCVGKKIHGLLYNSASPLEQANLLERFADECELLSRLHHPCIVQFLGVHFEPNSQLPVLVMEYLHTTLSACIDRYGILPREIRYEMLRDVILGLCYLHEHSPSIIHRDLSANNVLLAPNMSAKISDLGVAKILNLSPAQMGLMTQTQTPGTPCYMPPEAMIAQPKYTNKVDIFSFGVMMVHVLSGQWPIPGEVFQPDPANPNLTTPVSEADRRADYLQKIDQDHPLMGLIRQCLSNNPMSRPEAVDILGQVESVISRLPPSLENRVELIQQIQSQREDGEFAALRGEIEARSQENEVLREEMESRHRDIEVLRGEVETQRRENNALMGEIETARREINSKRTKNRAQKREIEASRREIYAGRREIEAGRKELESKRREVASMAEEVQALRGENQRQRRENERLKHQLESQVPNLTSIEAILQWRRCADLPVRMVEAQAVLVGGKICVGGGFTDTVNNAYLLFQYDRGRNGWSTLPPCPVRWFGLGQFKGRIITVGGHSRGRDTTNQLHCYKEESQRWEEYLRPMTTPRWALSVITTQSAIIACGGRDSRWQACATVEVYTDETGQWHIAASLPIRCYLMTSVIILNDTCYLFGGYDQNLYPTKTVLCATVTSLVEKAKSPPSWLSTLFKRSSSNVSVWTTLKGIPFERSTAASLSGCLLAVGGRDDQRQDSPAVHMFQPQTNSWVRMTSGDLPVAAHAVTAIQLPDNKLFVCKNFMLIGSITYL